MVKGPADFVAGTGVRRARGARESESQREKEDGQIIRFQLLSDNYVYLESKNKQADAKKSRVRSSALVTTALLLFFLEGASNFHQKPSPSFTVRKPLISLTKYKT